MSRNSGSATIVTNHAPVVIPHRQVIVTLPIVTDWSSTSVTTTTLNPIPDVPGVAVQPHPTTTIITNYYTSAGDYPAESQTFLVFTI